MKLAAPLSLVAFALMAAPAFAVDDPDSSTTSTQSSADSSVAAKDTARQNYYQDKLDAANAQTQMHNAQAQADQAQAQRDVALDRATQDRDQAESDR